MKVYEVSQGTNESTFTRGISKLASEIYNAVTGHGVSSSMSKHKGVDAIIDIWGSVERNLKPGVGIVNRKRLPAIQKRFNRLAQYAEEFQTLNSKIVDLEKNIQNMEGSWSISTRFEKKKLEAELRKLLDQKEDLLEKMINNTIEAKRLQYDPRPELDRIIPESKKKLKEGVTSFLIKWFEKRGAKFTQTQKNTLELHHAKYNSNEQQINKLTAESNAGENIDFKQLDRLHKEQEILKDEITTIGIEAGARVRKPVKEADAVISSGELRRYIRGLIDDAIDKEDDINKLSQILKMLIGKEIKSRGKRYVITSEDIRAALNAK